MFVADLDCGWLATPYEVQGLIIRSPDDIDRLHDYAKMVWVDPLKQRPLVMTGHIRIKPHPCPVKDNVSRSRQSQVLSAESRRAKPVRSYLRQNSALSEQPQALMLFETGKTKVGELLASAAVGSLGDLAQAEALVVECMASVLRNPDASLWMSRLRTQDEYTVEHCMNVAVLAMVFGRYLGMSEKSLVQLGLCGLLHDLGKMQVPLALLNKPELLSLDEYQQIQRHADEGYKLLSDPESGLAEVVAEAARSHHERMDGRGYPRQLPAKDLPEMVRIITLVDAYDAMTADRCYSPGISHTQALKIIYDERGKQFDEPLALEFIRCMGVYPPGSIVELTNGAVGLVQEVNEQYRHLPLVLILRDAEGREIEPYRVDLAQIEPGLLGSDHLIKRTLKNGALGIDIRTYTQGYNFKL